jgi:hypothetical protein
MIMNDEGPSRSTKAMCHDANEYEARAVECQRLANATKDAVLREQILSLSRIYLDFASHLRERVEVLEDWREAVNS